MHYGACTIHYQEDSMTVGFIGLGRMGSHMARHLAESGQELIVYDLRPEAIAQLTALPGVRAGKSYADVASNSEVVFTSLPGPPEVESVVLDEGGIRDSLKPGSTYVDLSTNSPALVRSLYATLAEKEIALLDAPVSGGVEGAAAGTLSIMAGGDEAVFERMKPLLSAIGTKLFYCGAIGAGSVVKLCNNILGATSAVILSESLTLGVKAGVDLKTLAEVIGASTGSSFRLLHKFPRYLFKGNFEPGFAIDLSAKDTRLFLELAEQFEVPLAMAAITDRELKAAQERGWGAEDSDALGRLQEERAGVQLRLSGE
jgi:2-hydroxymethylglutarate dehydrogenase